MTKKTQRQLELPILTGVKSKFTENSSVNTPPNSSSQTTSDISGFHRPASEEDQSIYQLMSDSYFSNSKK